MTTPTIAVERLHELSRFGADAHPVLSLYLDLDVTRFATEGAREVELSALLQNAGDADAAQVRALLEDQPELLTHAAALAIFSSAGADALDVVSLPEPVEPLAVVDTVPWLEPLAAMMTSENWGVAVITRRVARLFRGGPGMLVEFASIDDDVHGHHSRGAWAGLAQSRYARGIEQEIAWHLDHAVDGLLHAHRQHPFEHVLIVAPADLQRAIDAGLPPELRARVVGALTRDMEDATADEIEQAIAPVVADAARRREQELLAHVEEALGAGGRAAAGLDEVLALLEQRRVATLLVAHGAQLTAWSCPTCGRLSAGAAARCPVDDAPLVEVDALEHAVERALRDGTDVAVVRDGADRLAAHGSIAALLRW